MSVPRAPAWFRPQLAACTLFALASCLLWAGQSRAKPSVESAPVPSVLGPWMGKSLEVTDRVTQILETNDVSLMEYRLGKEPPVWFARVAGFGKRAAFHPPELCYVGGHFEVLERGAISVMVNGGEPRRLMRLVIGQGTERFEAWYWFTANGRVTPNYYRQQAWLVRDSMQRKPMSGTLVRISTPLNDPDSAHRRLLAFVTAWDAGQALSRDDS